MTAIRATPTPTVSSHPPNASASPSKANATPTSKSADDILPQSGWWYRAAAAMSRLNPTGYALRLGLVPGLYNAAGPTAAKSADAKVVCLTSLFGDNIDCRAFECRDPKAAGHLIVGFHGNCCTVDDLSDEWHWLANHGNVLAVNLPGYGATTAPNDGLALELHMAANVQAVAEHARARGYAPGDITWAGMSLGTSQAAIGFAMVPGSHAVFINGFTQVGAVAANCARRLGSFARPLAWQAAAAALPDGWRAKGLSYQTDRLNTEKKLQACSQTHRPLGSRLLVIAAEKDDIMPPEFAPALLRAYYGDHHIGAPPPCILHGGTHNHSFLSYAHACRTLRKFLAT